jgi:hypothetical protein
MLWRISDPTGLEGTGTMTRWSMESVRLGAGSIGIALVSVILLATQLVGNGAGRLV